MNSFAGRLTAFLGLDSAQFQRGIQVAQTRSRGLAAAFAAGRNLITPVTAAFAVATAAAAAFTIPAMRAAAEIDAVAKAARRVDGSFEGWSAARLAASEAGVAVDALADQVQNLNARLARPDPATTEALRSLGLSAQDLRTMDVDARLGAIADQVQALGLDAGQTTRLLRDLGIEDRRIANLITGGAAAFAAARADIRDYGLALSEIDTARIEQANDRIGRLSLVSRYMGQQLSMAVVPALGRMAQAITDSLREGGLLRGVLDAIAGTVSVVARGVESLVVIGAGLIQWLRDVAAQARDMGVQLFPALDRLGQLGSFLLAPIRGIYAMVTGFADLIRGAGGFGDAMRLLGELVAGVWEGIVGSARAIPAGLRAIWAGVQLDFLQLVARLRNAWADFLGGLSDTLRDGGLNIGGVLDGAADRLDAASARISRGTQQMSGQINDAMAAAEAASAEYASQTEAAWSRAGAAMEALREAVARGRAETETATPTVREFNLQLENTGAAGGGAARGVQAAAEAARNLQGEMRGGADALLGLIPAAQEGARGVLRYVAQMLQQIAMAQLRLMLLQRAGQASGGGFLGFLGRLLNPQIPGFANGVRNFSGGMARINERGGELVSLPGGSTVIPHDLSKRIVDGAAGGRVELVVHAAPGVTVEQVGQIAAGVSVRVMQSGMAQSRQGLPGSLRDMDLRGT